VSAILVILGTIAVLIGFWIALHAASVSTGISGGGAVVVLGVGIFIDALQKRRRG